MPLQLHYTKLKRKEINRTDFVRLVRKIAGQQLFQWGLENIKLQRHTQPSSVTMPSGAGINVDMSSKKRSTGQREPLEALHNHCLSSPWKKEKVSEAIPEQCIRELDRETAPSGVNTREEKQISSGHKEELWTLETAQKDVQKEERMILPKIPLQRKLAEISYTHSSLVLLQFHEVCSSFTVSFQSTFQGLYWFLVSLTVSKYDITYISNSVERCLSMCAEERMRTIITNLIKVSKMRVDPGVPVHQKSIMSDVRLQILMINRKAKEVDKKQRDEEDIMLLKLDEANKLAEDNIQITPTVALQTFVEKDDMLLKLQPLAEQARQKHDWRISAASKAANIAVRTAVGGEDLLVKWQLMAEQAWEKCQGGVPEDACQTVKNLKTQHPFLLLLYPVPRENQGALSLSGMLLQVWSGRLTCLNPHYSTASTRKEYADNHVDPRVNQIISSDFGVIMNWARLKTLSRLMKICSKYENNFLLK